MSISVAKLWPLFSVDSADRPHIFMRSQLPFAVNLAPYLLSWKLSEPDGGDPVRAINSTSRCLQACR